MRPRTAAFRIIDLMGGTSSLNGNRTIRKSVTAPAVETPVTSTDAADELEAYFHDRELEESGDTVTSTVRMDYHWRESGEYSHSMTTRAELTFRDGKIAAVKRYAPALVER